MPLNRREVLFYNVQTGSFSEMEILAAMVKEYGKPVHLTFNSLYYIPDQYPEIAEIIKRCMEIGFRSYIVADPALILYLREQNIDCEIHLSGETAEVNTGMVDFFQKMKLKRVIFHRKNTPEEMKQIIAHQSDTEFEAFVLNELCQFTGAFCNSLHCDEMGHLCRVPYQLCVADEKGRQEMAESVESEKSLENLELSETEACRDETGYLPGESGCGLCALWRLRDAGITHLKLVGRGNYTDFMEKDIRNLRKALDILESSETEKDYIKFIKKALFPCGCSGNCYYR